MSRPYLAVRNSHVPLCVILSGRCLALFSWLDHLAPLNRIGSAAQSARLEAMRYHPLLDASRPLERAGGSFPRAITPWQFSPVFRHEAVAVLPSPHSGTSRAWQRLTRVRLEPALELRATYRALRLSLQFSIPRHPFELCIQPRAVSLFPPRPYCLLGFVTAWFALYANRSYLSSPFAFASGLVG